MDANLFLARELTRILEDIRRDSLAAAVSPTRESHRVIADRIERSMVELPKRLMDALADSEAA